jgi:hypothetical protein
LVDEHKAKATAKAKTSTKGKAKPFTAHVSLDNADTVIEGAPPKRAALKLYALQIAASNLKRLQQEIEYVPSQAPAREKSLLQLLCEQLQIPEDERERAMAGFAEEAPYPIAHPGPILSYQPPAASDQPRAGASGRNPEDRRPQADDRFNINACAEEKLPRRRKKGWRRNRGGNHKSLRTSKLGRGGLGTAVALFPASPSGGFPVQASVGRTKAGPHHSQQPINRRTGDAYGREVRNFVSVYAPVGCGSDIACRRSAGGWVFAPRT